ncbi:MAG: 23S rRNA (uracil(1939)-C(5))-methyltransferase RlmD, partial [Oscillospiraceae bacterium]|nr:23S rRNA (uracil(1939)-C(5))-methyltransferase RlmD [Oscillospiraceae bacterium]
MKRPEKNTIFNTVIEHVAGNAMGVCRLDGYVVFVRGALAGEECTVRLIKSGASYGYGKIERLITPSPDRIDPDCPYFPVCGGCDMRHMTYASELRTKLNWVNESLSRIGGVDVPAESIAGAPEGCCLRNKAIFAVGERSGMAVCGFYRNRSHDIVPVKNCLLLDPRASAAAECVAEWINKSHIPAGAGGVRHVFVRSAFSNGSVQVCLVSSCGKLPHLNALTAALKEKIDGLTGVLLNINTNSGNVILSDRFRTIWGERDLEDRIGDLRFRISPRSFFQVNPAQAEVLYKKAAQYAGLSGKERVLDLYCGIGTISLSVASGAAEVVGIEEIDAAVENAKNNAVLNGIDNARFFCCDANDSARLLKSIKFRPDIVVVDPPRKGLGEGAIELIDSLPSQSLIYISCNPATLARDLRSFISRGWECRRVTCVDMFPRTAHVETVCALSKLSEAKHHINIQVDMDELDLTAAESKATYEEIQAWVQEK